MTLSSVLDQVAKLPLPLTKEQEEDDVFSLCRCCTDLIAFIRPFVQEARLKHRNSDELSKSTNKVEAGWHTDEEDELRTELLKL